MSAPWKMKLFSASPQSPICEPLERSKIDLGCWRRTADTSVSSWVYTEPHEQVPGRVGIQTPSNGPRARASWSTLHCSLPSPPSGHLCRGAEPRRPSVPLAQPHLGTAWQLKFLAVLHMSTNDHKDTTMRTDSGVRYKF